MVEPDPQHTVFTRALAAVLEEQMQFLGLGQRALARESGVTQAQIHHILTGTVSPRAYTLRRLALGLDLHLSEFIDMVEEEMK